MPAQSTVLNARTERKYHDISDRRYDLMEANKKKIMDHIQDLGALIALLLLVVGISIISPEFRSSSEDTMIMAPPFCAKSLMML